MKALSVDDNLTLITSKFHLPPVTTRIVVRARLVEQLRHGLTRPLTLVCAPAGYGKTTLVSAYLSSYRSGSPTAWLAVDEQDSELEVFVRYFCASVRTLFAGACARTLALVQAPHPAPIGALIATLSNELAALPHEFVFVLDDYHAIVGTDVPELLAGIACYWPRTLHLVLLTRRNPLLPLASLRAKNQLAEIRTRDLQFTASEAAQYIAQELGEAPADPLLQQLLEQTEGWIAGLHLAILALQGRSDATVAHLAATNANIAEYLLSEFLEQQPPYIAAFMLTTSVVDRFCVALYEYLVEHRVEEHGAGECVAWLERTTLLLVVLDDQHGWYRYHHLLQEFLQLRAAEAFGHDQICAWRRRAAEWFAAQDLTDEALQYALAGGDLEQAASVMERGLCAVLNRPDPAMLRRWLSFLPQDFRRRSPSLLLIEALVLHFANRFGELAALLQKIEPLLSHGPASSSHGAAAILRGQFLTLRAVTAYFANQPAAGVAWAQKALLLLPASWMYMRGLSLYWLGLNGQVIGQVTEVDRQLWSQYVAAPVKYTVAAAAVLNSLCTMAFFAGQLERVKQTAMLLVEQSRRGAMATMEGWGHFWLGAVYYEWNEPAPAAAHLNEVANLRYSLNSFVVHNGLSCLASLQAALGDLAGAGQTVELLSRYDLDDLGYETFETGALRAQLDFQYGDTAAAVRWAVAFTQPVPHQPQPQLYNAHYIKASILLAGGTLRSTADAMALINALTDVAVRTFHTRLQVALLALQALASHAQGQARAAHTTVTAALALAEPGGFIRTFIDLGPRMQALIAHTAAQRRSESPAPAYMQRILAAFAAETPVSVRPDAAASGLAPRTSALGAVEFDPLEKGPVEPLTAREIEILALIGERLSDKEIARTLSIATSTVHRHIANLYRKLDVNRRWDAVIKAKALGVLPR